DVLVANSHSAVSVNQASKFELSSAYPNPFNPVTSFVLSVADDVNVSIVVYNAMGQKVDVLADEAMSRGMYSFNWNASSMSSGVYFIRAQSGFDVSTQKIVLIK
ncbi:MAG: hypothetical protein CBD58_01510, partial [bacterium TMED198]